MGPSGVAEKLQLDSGGGGRGGRWGRKETRVSGAPVWEFVAVADWDMLDLKWVELHGLSFLPLLPILPLRLLG